MSDQDNRDGGANETRVAPGMGPERIDEAGDGGMPPRRRRVVVALAACFTVLAIASLVALLARGSEPFQTAQPVTGGFTLAVTTAQAPGTDPASSDAATASEEASETEQAASGETKGAQRDGGSIGGGSEPVDEAHGERSSAGGPAAAPQSPGGDVSDSDDDLITVGVHIESSAVGNPVHADVDVDVPNGTSAFEALVAAIGIDNMNVRDTAYGKYVAAIGGLAEFDGGPESGWMYRVNGGTPPNFTIDKYALHDGDQLQLYYVKTWK